jgi:acetyltransferase-like isoleucine patch superfamily enzyme
MTIHTTNTAQPLVTKAAGQVHIEGDWFPRPLPDNVELGPMSYPDTSYSFTTFFSEQPVGFSLGYASGNYGHGLFTTGRGGQIHIGDFVVLQCTRIISNVSVRIGDHCMFSWGSVITDSWPMAGLEPGLRRQMLQQASESATRHIEYLAPQPVDIGENVWVGFEAIIMPGVTIGRGAVIGCKAVVGEDVPAYAVVAGNPARIVRYLDPTDTDELKQQALSGLSGTFGSKK